MTGAWHEVYWHVYQMIPNMNRLEEDFRQTLGDPVLECRFVVDPRSHTWIYWLPKLCAPGSCLECGLVVRFVRYVVQIAKTWHGSTCGSHQLASDSSEEYSRESHIWLGDVLETLGDDMRDPIFHVLIAPPGTWKSIVEPQSTIFTLSMSRQAESHRETDTLPRGVPSTTRWRDFYVKTESLFKMHNPKQPAIFARYSIVATPVLWGVHRAIWRVSQNTKKIKTRLVIARQCKSHTKTGTLPERKLGAIHQACKHESNPRSESDIARQDETHIKTGTLPELVELKYRDDEKPQGFLYRFFMDLRQQAICCRSPYAGQHSPGLVMAARVGTSDFLPKTVANVSKPTRPYLCAVYRGSSWVHGDYIYVEGKSTCARHEEADTVGLAHRDALIEVVGSGWGMVQAIRLPLLNPMEAKDMIPESQYSCISLSTLAFDSLIHVTGLSAESHTKIGTLPEGIHIELATSMGQFINNPRVRRKGPMKSYFAIQKPARCLEDINPDCESVSGRTLAFIAPLDSPSKGPSDEHTFSTETDIPAGVSLSYMSEAYPPKMSLST
ncbi:hypothetical protein M434DRAFT_31384 [Hypoxylon sp. CO27-5]|nr:hypothetical protein M434DRAFT_31384 [Hypoxylon sp. CO27-5]